MNKHFSKESIPVANRYMERCSPSLVIKTTVRYYLIPAKMTGNRKITKYAGKNLEKLEPRCGEGNGNPLQSSCLETSMDGGAW